MRSRLARICWILLLSGPHCAGWPLNRTKKLFFSQPARCASRLLAVDLGLLVGGGLLELAKLLGAGRIVAAAVEGLELGLQPRAVGILLRCGCGGCCWACTGSSAAKTAAAGTSARQQIEFIAFPSRVGLTPPLNPTLRPEWCPKFGRLSPIRSRFGGLGLLRAAATRRTAVTRPAGSTTRRR